MFMFTKIDINQAQFRNYDRKARVTKNVFFKWEALYLNIFSRCVEN